ncbi:MAG TPA: polysaccharide deacetylase family protein [Clostridiaceae bacterium]|jgi:peptidoglycan/xylan/chitin deacetylase (PgdA/CDA1 family)|nr:polysaccharide deacetylase family protein [Clostridiaceae bacterium]
MFIVFNKEKIYSYVIALSTIVVLFMMANVIVDRNKEAILTSSQNKLLPIYSVDTEEKKVALTMNCAWNADDIDSILDTLSKNKVHITFFMVGDWVDKYPEYVKKIADNGHEIANHSNTHPHVNNLSLSQNSEEIRLCSEKIEKITGKPTTLYRGPYGEYNNTVINAADEQKHKTIQWNLDTLDYTRSNR